MRIRAATPDDQAFLEEMLRLAATRRDEAGGGALDPSLSHYVEEFGREGDVGVVAEVDGVPAGAAWARRFDPARPGYGFVAADVPELSIGVRADYRGRGLGAQLIEALSRELGAAGYRSVSLSVEPDNPAKRIYERAGFEAVGTHGGSVTMVRRLGGERPALIVVDVQRAFDDPSWGRRNNPHCERNIEVLIAHWRERGRPLVFVRHDSDEPGSTLAADSPGHAFKDVITGEPDLLVTKSVNSSFHGDPSLQVWLDGEGIRTIYVCGITTNHCCETTARVGGNLGYDVRFVLDATHTFDRPDPFGGVVTADELARVTATNLHEEFATVVDTATATRT